MPLRRIMCRDFHLVTKTADYTSNRYWINVILACKCHKYSEKDLWTNISRNIRQLSPFRWQKQHLTDSLGKSPVANHLPPPGQFYQIIQSARLATLKLSFWIPNLFSLLKHLLRYSRETVLPLEAGSNQMRKTTCLRIGHIDLFVKYPVIPITNYYDQKLDHLQ